MTIFKSKSARFRYEKWGWVLITLLCGFLRTFFREFWEVIEGIVITLMSGYALVATFAGAESAAEAKEIAEKQGEK